MELVEVGRVGWVTDYPARVVVLFVNWMPPSWGPPRWKEVGRCATREELGSFVLTIDGEAMSVSDYLKRLPPSVYEDKIIDLSWFWTDMAETAPVC